MGLSAKMNTTMDEIQENDAVKTTCRYFVCIDKSIIFDEIKEQPDKFGWTW
jgi:hypothetical protein